MNKQFDEITVGTINSNIKYVKPGETIQDTINSITDASEINPYTVVIPPGVYGEDISLNSNHSYINLKGFGIGVTKVNKIDIQDSSNWLIEGIEVVGIGAQVPDSSLFLHAHTVPAINGIIKNCSFRKIGTTGTDDREVNVNIYNTIFSEYESSCSGQGGVIKAYNCEISGGLTQNPIIWTTNQLVLLLYNCKIGAQGENNQGGLLVQNISLALYVCCVYIDGDGYGIALSSNGGILEIYGGSVKTTSIFGVKDIMCYNGILNVYGTKYDTSFGTIGGDIKVPEGLNVGDMPEYADNTAALAGGLVAGDFYRTGDISKIVH